MGQHEGWGQGGDWVGLDWIGMYWIGLDWNVMEWIALDCIGLATFPSYTNRNKCFQYEDNKRVAAHSCLEQDLINVHPRDVNIIREL